MVMDTIDTQIFIFQEHLGRFCWKSEGLELSALAQAV